MDFNVQLYLAIGGREAMRPVIELFYAGMAADPWLGQWFVGVDLGEQARRLENFLCSGAPGEPHYVRNYPMIAHAHMYITQPMIKERVRLLRAAIEALGHPPEIVKLWLRTDALWHGAVVKDSVHDCRPEAVGKPLKVIDERLDADLVGRDVVAAREHGHALEAARVGAVPDELRDHHVALEVGEREGVAGVLRPDPVVLRGRVDEG